MSVKISKWSLLLAAGAAVGLGGCQTGKTAENRPGAEFSSGLAALLEEDAAPAFDSASFDDLLADSGDPDELEELIQSSYETLERAFLDAEEAPLAVAVADEPEVVSEPTTDLPVSEDVLATFSSEYESGGAGLEALMSEAAPAAALPAAETGAFSMIQAAARDLAEAILGQMPFSLNPVEDAVALVGLESLVPGISDTALEIGMLTDEERAYVEAAQRLNEAARSMDGDPDAAADVAQQISMDIAETRPIRVTRAELCTRVDGYGQYMPFASDRFVAGKRHRVIVYVEVDRLGHTIESPALGETTPQFSVELTQRIEVYHSADDVLAMATPTLTDHRVGRNRFRDYYLVTAVDLPETLSVGEYKIKVTMRDASDDGVSQAFIPLTVVADASAVPTDTP